jgi:hypothetical protein
VGGSAYGYLHQVFLGGKYVGENIVVKVEMAGQEPKALPWTYLDNANPAKRFAIASR